MEYKKIFAVGDKLRYPGLYGGLYTCTITGRTNDSVSWQESWMAADTGEKVSADVQKKIEVHLIDGIETEVARTWTYHGASGYVVAENLAYKVWGLCHTASEGFSDGLDSHTLLFPDREGAKSAALREYLAACDIYKDENIIFEKISSERFLQNLEEDGYVTLQGDCYHESFSLFESHIPTPLPISHEKRPEFVGRILDVFEDFLEEKGIMIKNPEKQAAIADGEDPEEICNLYGSDYGALQSEIEDILHKWNILEPYN